MPDQLLELALADHAAIVKDRFALLETENASLKAQGVELATQLNRAVAEAAALKAQIANLPTPGAPLPAGLPILKSGERPEAGKAYIMDRGPVRYDVTVPNVTLFGNPDGPSWPIPNGPLSAVTALPGGDGLSVLDAVFDWLDGPTGRAKLPIRDCVRTYAANVTVSRCTFGRVDCALRSMAPANGFLVTHCTGGLEVRSSFLYCGGGKGVTLLHTTAADSTTENLVRFSPENNVVPENALIAYCTLTNREGKAAVELRSVNNAVVWRNTVTAAHGHTCISVGRSRPNEGPGSTNCRVLDNDCYKGRLEIDAGASNVRMEDNRQYDLRYGMDPAQRDNYDIGLSVNGKPGTLFDVRLYNNVGYIGGATLKPYLGGSNHENITGLVESANRWEIRQ